jgi:hypothetical protein
MRLILISRNMLTHKTTYWSIENPHALIHLPLYDQQRGVVSLGRYFMKELLMLNDALMK